MKSAALFPVSDHCDGRAFFNPGHKCSPRLTDVLRWKFTSRPKTWPVYVATAPAPRPCLSATDVRATLINHASFLVETPQGNILIDPVYSACCGPFGKFGPRRVHAPGIPLHELPDIHFVLLSHDHYDHCDLPTLRRIAKAHDPLAITPLGNRNLLVRAGFTRIVELDWWQNHTHTENLAITVTPAQHWSNRLSGRRCRRLWGGFYLHAGKTRLYFVGDTGYHATLFTDVRTRLGAPDLAFVPIGAYEPRWFMREQHCDPAEAVQIHRDLGARKSVAMHWGTFQLTDEGRDDPPHELTSALESAGVSSEDFRILEPGGSLVVSS
jgi:L-ascorbate metabolism protein UlaG (beta-lactamase superfamily)